MTLRAVARSATTPDPNVATTEYVDNRLSQAQRTALDALDPLTATVADIVNALQAT